MKDLKLIEFAKFGIDIEKLTSYQVLFLPDNYQECTEIDKLYNSIDGIEIYKQLNNRGIKCADFSDLGVDVSFLERRNSDIWLGVIWVIDNLALPIIVSLISGLLLTLIKKNKSNNNDNKPQLKVNVELKIKRNKNNSSILRYSGDPKTLEKILKAIDKSDSNEN